MDQTTEIAGKIFSLLKGNGLKIQMFDENGASTADPDTGRRFFVMKPNIMVTINSGDDKSKPYIEFSKGSTVGDSVRKLESTIKRYAESTTTFLFTPKVFGKSIQPRDFAFQAKANKGKSVMENSAVKPINHHLLGKVLHKVRYFGSAMAGTLADDIGVSLAEVQPILNRLVQDGKIQAIPTPGGDMEYSMAVDEAVMEDTVDPAADAGMNWLKQGAKDLNASPKTRIQYKQGQYKLGQNKQNKNNTKNPMRNPIEEDSTDPTDIYESWSRMFGSAKTSQQTLENVRILVKHKVAVDENVRGSRTRHIGAIFLECNGERFRFPHNYLPGARAMAQHMAHGGAMTDKVGSYIAESTGQLLKLQSFNRYVTTNKLINEDSSGIVETVKENIETIRTELKKLTGVKTYETVKARLETFEREPLAEDDTSQLKELFTIRRFDEKFEEVLPIVKQLVQERDTYYKRIEEAAANIVLLRRESINKTPMFEFASDNARLGFKISELSLRMVENEELSGFVNKIGTKLCKEGVVNDFERAVLKQVFENAKVVENAKKADKKEIKESKDLESFFNRYDYNFM